MKQMQTSQTLTAADLLKQLKEWCHSELAKLNQQRLQAGRNPGNQELQAGVQANLVRESTLIDILNAMEPRDNTGDWADSFPPPENNLLDESWS